MTFFENEEKNKKFIHDNLMGPNAVLILEELLEKIKLTRQMRVLDLGCGTGLTSMYVAKKTGAQVVAADLWISPADNYKRFKQVGLDKQIIPLRLDVTQPLPFAEDYFDAVISIDSFHYYGTGEDFLDKKIIPLVKKDGLIAVGAVGRRNEEDDVMFKKMEPYLQGEKNFHALDWWKKLWQKSPNIEIMAGFSMKCHQQAWKDWLAIDSQFSNNDVVMMKADDGKFFDTIGLIAKVIKSEASKEPTPWQALFS